MFCGSISDKLSIYRFVVANSPCSDLTNLFQTGLSAIHIAAQYGRTEVVREILRQADIGDIRSEVHMVLFNHESSST
jgi:hypothetical protein